MNPLGSNLPIVGKLAQKNGKRIQREEEFSSRHIAELTDAYDQIKGLMEQKQREIDQLMENGNSHSENDDEYDEEEQNDDDHEEGFDHEAALK